jgi:hypothetical protein
MADFDRFEDALTVRAGQLGTGSDAYIAGYLLSMIQNLLWVPEVAKAVDNHRMSFEEGFRKDGFPVDEEHYMGA